MYSNYRLCSPGAGMDLIDCACKRDSTTETAPRNPAAPPNYNGPKGRRIYSLDTRVSSDHTHEEWRNEWPH